MEKTTQTRISDLELAAANKHAKRLLNHNELADERLEELATLYTAALNAGVGAADALEISSGLVRGVSSPVAVHAYSIEDFLEQVDENSIDESIAGINEFLRSREEHPPRIRLKNKLYERFIEREEVPRLIGLDSQYAQLEKHLYQLSSWNPQRLDQDVDEIDWESGILLYGPPGTGKSSLCMHAQQHLEYISSKSRIPLRVESLQPTDYNMYVGESEKNIKRKIDRVADPSGVGLLILEEVDMLTEDRSQISSSARQGVTNTIMQSLSGFDGSPYKNFLVIGTSNHPENIDSAMDRRLAKKLLIPGFSQRNQYEALASRKLEWASQDILSYVSKQGFERSLSPSLMKAYCTHINSQRLQDLDVEIFSLPLSERKAAFDKLYVDLSLDDVRSATEHYSF